MLFLPNFTPAASAAILPSFVRSEYAHVPLQLQQQGFG